MTAAAAARRWREEAIEGMGRRRRRRRGRGRGRGMNGFGRGRGAAEEGRMD